MKCKIIIIFLTCALCLSTLCGCSKSSDDASDIETSVEKDTEISVLPPASVGMFETTDIYGNSFDQDLFQDYDLTLVNIFATWCSPCVNELPELEQIHHELGEKYNINVVGILMDSVDENFHPASNQDTIIETAKTLAEKTGVTYPILIPEKTALNGRLIGIDAYPETFFVDKDGNIVGETYVGSGSYNDWSEVIENELANLKTDAEQ